MQSPSTLLKYLSGVSPKSERALLILASEGVGAVLKRSRGKELELALQLVDVELGGIVSGVASYGSRPRANESAAGHASLSRPLSIVLHEQSAREARHEQMCRRWNRAHNEGSALGMASVYAPDALLWQCGNGIAGRGAIAAHLSSRFGGSCATAREVGRIIGIGDFVLATYTYSNGGSGADLMRFCGERVTEHYIFTGRL